MSEMELFKQTIYGEPKTKKNSQQILMNRKTGRPFITQSAAYKKYERACGNQIILSGATLDGPIKVPVNIKCVYFRSTYRRCDLTNLLEATDDILVNFGVIADDSFQIVRSHDGSTVFVDKGSPRVEIEITEIHR